MKKEQKDFLNDIKNVEYYGSEAPNSELYKKFYDGLSSGKYKKPSEFFSSQEWIFGGMVKERFKAAFLWTADNCIKWQYDVSYWRRSMRTADYTVHIKNILHILRDFYNIMCIDADIADVLERNISEEETAYIDEHTWRSFGYTEEIIAYELDRKNERLEKVIEDIIIGEGKTLLSREIIRGIVKSENVRMHELLGKLLLAARLQEGLRQSICENADCGTVSAFLYLLRIIDENGLVRFSSVKRAVGTWTGILNPDMTSANETDRISVKSISLIKECVESEEVREKYLCSEDSMEIYTALWAYGFNEAKTAVEKVRELSEKGSHHQILTAGYFVSNMENAKFAHSMAKKIIAEHSSEADILAVYMPYFLGNWNSWSIRNKKKELCVYDEKRNYKDRSEALKYYDILWGIFEDMPKKTIDFSPCIFPWYSASLTKSCVAEKICITSKIIDDDDKTDKCLEIIKDCDTSVRASITWLMLEKPKSSLQKKILTEMLGDRESYTRDTAYKLICDITPESENYLQMESMLRYKAADIRSNLISLLYKQDDEALYNTAERLTNDKKEEKRTAGLDIIMQLSKDEKRQSLFERCRELALNISKPSTKEKILIDSILGETENTADESELFSECDRYSAEVPDDEFTKECVSVFMRYFPESKLGNSLYPDIYKEKKKNGFISKIVENISGKDADMCDAYAVSVGLCRKLDELMQGHRNDEFFIKGEAHTIDGNLFYETLDDGSTQIPFIPLWEKFYEENIKSPELALNMYIALMSYTDPVKMAVEYGEYIESLYGKGFSKYSLTFTYSSKISSVLNFFIVKYISEEDKKKIAYALILWIIKNVPDEKMLIKETTNGYTYNNLFVRHNQIFPVLRNFYNKKSNDCFALKFNFDRKLSICKEWNGYYINAFRMSADEYILAAYNGIISEKALYCYIFDDENTADSLEVLSGISSVLNDEGRQVSQRGGYYSWRVNSRVRRVKELLSKNNDEPYTDEERKLLEFADNVYHKVINVILSAELTRGDSETKYSKAVMKTERIYGIENFVKILSALGSDTLERSTWYYYNSNVSKKQSLSHLLSVCIPYGSDNAEKLKQLIKGTDITEKRLIEAALYSPEWIDIVGEYLKWDGFKSACYYFMAHMNERFDGRRKAIIAKFTPLTENELSQGSFDINWFRNAYETLGEKRFNVIYNAAKYISDGTKHSRARKYADAVLGKFETESTQNEIIAKRNKDLLMAYTLIPLKNEDDICERYLYLQKFLKESKKFGSQRIASEKKAVDISMQNLAINAGYADVTRLTLRMETKLIDDSRELFEDKAVDDIIIRLQVDEYGKAEIICSKNGKALKSVPARLKKNEYIMRISDTKKALTEQYRRTRQMFEQAMEDSVVFTAGEIRALRKNPVVLPIIKNLVFIFDGKIGFLDEKNMTDYAGNEFMVKDSAEVTVAHPVHIYKDGHWTEYQKYLFDRRIVQPFKQVFRELYIKTDEEMKMTHSLRYSGNQIQPAKTAACLKSRRWVADIEDGLQKVYYNENIVARIYAMADWFSPADIEAPTLEWVEFCDRNTWRPVEIEKIPDIIFSEVMRDVDLAVSVAHAGGVDPETSHSTIEMRSALLGFTLPLFKADNVKLIGSHAHIEGKLGEYTVHLGSGVIHKKGGAMINILPVHSQHRGKLFLPFADDDPKTAEIVTKVLMLADDSKIKDPTILSQIK